MDKEKKLSKKKDFVVIGLGRFGRSVATGSPEKEYHNMQHLVISLLKILSS